MRKLILTAVATMAATPALAATPTIIFTPGVFTVPPSTTAQVFQTFEGFAVGPASGTSLNTTGDVRIAQGTVPGQSVNPDNNGDRFLAIENGSFTVNFASAVQFFSFSLGTLDSYNSLTLNFADNTSQTFFGTQIIGAPTAGPLNSTVSGRASFDLGGQAGILSAVFSSTQAAFEIDDLASAVPEPATWGMMILGFGIVGSQLRRRRSTKTLATA
jgi:hypothetical protein